MTENFGNGRDNWLVWCDIETTGLEEEDRILEIALVSTNWDLVELRHITTVINFEGSNFPSLPNIVLRMHTANGLLKEVAHHEGLNLDEAEKMLVNWIGEYGGPIAGSTPSFDMRFIRKYMPALAKCFDHRCFDVSTLKQAHRMWKGPWQKDAGTHRALADVRASIEECRRLHDAMWIISKEDEDIPF